MGGWLISSVDEWSKFTQDSGGGGGSTHESHTKDRDSPENTGLSYCSVVTAQQFSQW